MGTRNIMTIKVDNKTKVVQYCQWDGYPTGQGADIANFIQNKLNMRIFKKQVRALKSYSNKKVSQIWKEAGADEMGYISFENAKKIEETHPELSRDTGAKLLGLIADGKVTKVSKATGQMGKSWIEYVYEIDLDRRVVRVSVDGGKKFIKKVAFKNFTPKYMPQLDKEISEIMGWD